MSSLSELLDPSLIQTDISVFTFTEAIEQSYLPFLKEGLIEKQYIEEVKKSYQVNGPYFVLAPGICLPHSDACAMVNKSALGITVLKNPVLSGSRTNDPVKILFPLCAVDSQSHLEALQKLTDVLEDDKAIKKILASHDAADIYQTIIFEHI